MSTMNREGLQQFIKEAVASKQENPKLSKPYSRGAYNYSKHDEQWIRLSEGCPNGCPYCMETKVNGKDPVYFPIPEITENNVKLLDMNLLYKPKAKEIIDELGSRRVDGKVVYYELICGIDYRYMTDELAVSLKNARFINLRLAWDFGFIHQKKMKNAIDMLLKAGYKANDLTIFMICNWKIPYVENMRKLDLCKIWNVKVADCYFDNQISPDIKPIWWSLDEIKKFRTAVRKHNQLVGFKIDPEI